MKRPLISDEWAREYHSENSSGIRDGIFITPLTFCGAFEDKYNSIARNWNNDTRIKYDRDLNNVILPHIDNHNTKLISEYTEEDCNNIIKAIEEDGYIEENEQKEYSESQINHFRYLLYLVFQYSFKSGYCKNFLWGTKYEIRDDRDTLAKRIKTIIKRSLSVKQEKRLLETLMESPREDGRLIALLLMFALGLRDGEACGLDYGCIYELPYHKGCFVAIIKQSTIPNSNKLQSSGKTWNSGRRIPIPSKVLAFILERKRIVERLIKENGLELDINSIPIASKGYLKDGSVSFERLRADSLTDISKDVFQAVGISSEVLSTLEIEMEEGIEKLEVSESSVTAYLLRRNFATHLKILGLDHPDIQYLLGHCIDDPYVNRPDYTDSRLYSISKLLSNRPLVNEAPETTICLAPYSDTTLSGNETIKMNSNGTTVVRIYALEKEDSLIIKPNDSIILNYREEYKAFEPHRGIDILKKYMGDYGTS